MLVNESIESINQQLIDLFGIDTLTGLPMWRVVWSNDQYEKRLMDTTDTGIILLHPEVRLVPKYQWIKSKFLLERLVLVPEIQQNELPTSKLSYEPMYTYEDNNGNALPPHLEVTKFIINGVLAVQGKTNLAKYKDPEADPETTKRRIAQIQEELFGEETDATDALAYGEGVVVPQSFETTKIKEN